MECVTVGPIFKPGLSENCLVLLSTCQDERWEEEEEKKTQLSSPTSDLPQKPSNPKTLILAELQTLALSRWWKLEGRLSCSGTDEMYIYPLGSHEFRASC